MVTSGVMQNADPKQWRKHRFGLPEERWRLLSGKSFWITGAGTGYGRCIAIALAGAGAQVFLTGRRREKLEETLAEANSFGIDISDCHLLAGDITNSTNVRKLAEEIQGLCPALYGLVNNAALPPPPFKWPLMDMPLDEWNYFFSINMTAQWLVSQAILPHMVKGNGLRIVFITSEAGWASTPGFGPYNIAKSAINSLGSSLAAECVDRYPHFDAQINVLVPGEARTEMNQGSKESPYSIVSMALILLSHPTGGANGKYFHRDGRHLDFAYTPFYEKLLL